VAIATTKWSAKALNEQKNWMATVKAKSKAFKYSNRKGF